MNYQTPHGDKLKALLQNTKLPSADVLRVEAAINKYDEWVVEVETASGNGLQCVEALTLSLNQYKNYIDLELIFDSKDDFLHRQKGQLKLDNTILEEFLPRLVDKVYSEKLVGTGVVLGPTTAFSQLRFESGLLDDNPGRGMAIRSKDHDFAMARPLFLKASHRQDFYDSSEVRTHLAYMAAEIKTNLDKTMFQEASAPAYDLRLALPHSRYFLLCEWLDMTPISTAVTAIAEVIVLRKAKRLPAQIRARFSTASERRSARAVYADHLHRHPFATDAFLRFLFHAERFLGITHQNEEDALQRGWF